MHCIYLLNLLTKIDTYVKMIKKTKNFKRYLQFLLLEK